MDARLHLLRVDARQRVHGVRGTALCARAPRDHRVGAGAAHSCTRRPCIRRWLPAPQLAYVGGAVPS